MLFIKEFSQKILWPRTPRFASLYAKPSLLLKEVKKYDLAEKLFAEINGINIFAGEVLLVVISFLVPYIIPIPFYGLELFVGFIQALVFSMLTLVFMTVGTMEHEEH